MLSKGKYDSIERLYLLSILFLAEPVSRNSTYTRTRCVEQTANDVPQFLEKSHILPRGEKRQGPLMSSGLAFPVYAG